mgnify:CR=1 FL=1
MGSEMCIRDRWNSLYKRLELVAPEHLILEIESNLPEIKQRSKLSEHELKEILDLIEEQIDFIPESKFSEFLSKAYEVSPPNDFPYIALAMFFKSSGYDVRILSNDKDLLDALKKIGLKGITIHDLLRELKLV